MEEKLEVVDENNIGEGRNYTVYMHTSPSGKRYIGITSRSVNERWQNGRGYIGQVFYRAIQKYGFENFKHEVLYTNLTKEEAESKEVELISFYNSGDSRYGYNVSNGGSSVGKHSDETKRKIAEKATGRKPSEETLKKLSEIHRNISDETRKKMSESRKGEKNPNFGKEMPYETRMKLSEAHKGKKLSPEHVEKIRKNSKDNYPNVRQKMKDALARAVTQYSGDGEFIKTYECIVDGADETGCIATQISACCKGKRKKTKGFIWRYADEILTDEHIAWCNDHRNYGAMKSVAQYNLNGELIKVHDGIVEAEMYTGISNNSICNCCNRKYKTAGGYIWRYSDDILTQEELEWCNEDYRDKYRKEIIQYSMSGEFIKKWKSATDITNSLCFDNSGIGKACKGIYKSSYGYIWRYADDEDN